MDEEFDAISLVIKKYQNNPAQFCLNLSNRKLAIIPSTLFEILDNVQILLLNGNKLIIPPAEISMFSSTLVELTLSNNNLTVFPSELGRLKKLQTLDISCNNFGALPSEIGKLGSLLHLWVNHCNLLLLPPEIGNLNNLLYLGARHNSLQSFPRTLKNLVNLKWINCANNCLEDLSDVEIGDEIIHIDLSNNQLSAIPSFVKDKTHLKVLLLCGNNIVNMDDEALLQLSNVTKLDLRINPMKSLPEHWKGMSHILVGERRANPTEAELQQVKDILQL